ncbi:MAG: aminotransferase class I/II-fold pyridoxal phosphate-dependent enzyme [Alphaproteobacteria bacterium]|nr:aminotransferase class I/II-fold pyridoxal phosphate-dependent enzyme [Alphaproteobacteria bacterium]
MRYAPFVKRLENKGSRAWEIHGAGLERIAKGHDVIMLSIGDPDFETPSGIVEAAVASLRAGNTHYSWIEGSPELRRAIAERFHRLNGVAVGADSIVVTQGAQGALFSAMVCVAGPGDEVIVPEPMYVTYEAVVGAAGATLVTVPLRGERGFHLDPADLAEAVTSRTRAVLLNTPHNPTGAVLSRDELAAVGAICRRHDLWLISDEVYATITFAAPHISPATLPEIADRTIVVESLSKSHAMCGWRVGWIVAPGELPHHLYNLGLAMHYGLPSFIQTAAIDAVRSEDAAAAAMRETYRTRRDLVADRVRNLPLLDCVVPEGAMYVMVDVRGTGLASETFARRLLDEADVAVLPADGFGPSGAGYVRWSLTVPTPRLEMALDRLGGFARRMADAGAITAR